MARTPPAYPAESRRRTLVKALLWQGIGLLSMTLIGWAMTGSVALGGSLAAINMALGFVTYVFYERFWARVRWGIDGSGR
ncbi:MAG: DUF2061 domain-containing protein [Gemmobacter sp.]